MNAMFSQALSHLRHEKGVSQRVVAQELGISQALLSHYENGIREPGLDFVVRVCDYYRVSADYLLGRTSDRSGGASRREDGRPDPAALVRTADALCQVCVELYHQEPDLGLLFQRLTTRLSKELGRSGKEG